MRCITKEESIAWIARNGINGVDDHGETSVVGEHGIRYVAPKKARDVERLASNLVRWVGRFQSALLWVTDWPFYTPVEMALVQALRRSHKETRPLIHAPGHLFEWTELEELSGWVGLMVAWGWDAYLFTHPFTERMFQSSHEDFVWVTASSRSQLHTIKDALAPLCLKAINEE